MKKVIFAVLALILAITLVTCGYFLITSLSLQKYSVDEGVPCPYSWQELRSGAYRLEIDTTAYPDHSWSVECYPKNVIAATPASIDSGTAVFSFLPLNMGQAYVRVYCEQTSPFTVCIFEIGMHLNVSEDLEISVEKTEHTVYDGITTISKDGEYPVQWWTNPNGIVNLLISGESTDWEAMDYDLNNLDVTGPFYREDSCGFEIRGKLAGTFPLTIYDGAGKALRLEVKVADDLTATVTTLVMEDYTPDRSGEHAALESTVGRVVTLPPRAVATEYSIKAHSGSVGFLLNDLEWYWKISPTATADDIVDDIEYAAERKTATAGGVTLTAYLFSDSVAVSWSDGSCAMALFGQREATLTDALAIAGQIVEANHG